MEPPNKGHLGNGPSVLSSEIVSISEVWHALVVSSFNDVLQGRNALNFMTVTTDC